MSLVHGFGINDADYVVRPAVNGKRVMCSAYASWSRMVERVHSEREQIRNPTYIGVSICDEWRSFMKFREWWIENHVEGWHLDKDLLTDNRQYSPENCIYVPVWLNTFTCDSRAKRGRWPIGVSLDRKRGKFLSMCSNPLSGKKENLGYYSNPEDAYNAWLQNKLLIAKKLKPSIDEIDERIYDRLIEILRRTK